MELVYLKAERGILDRLSLGKGGFIGKGLSFGWVLRKDIEMGGFFAREPETGFDSGKGTFGVAYFKAGGNPIWVIILNMRNSNPRFR